MNKIDTKYYNKLEINQIFEALKAECFLPSTKNYIDSIEPIEDIEDVRIELAKVDEARMISTKFTRAAIYLNKDLDEFITSALKDAVIAPIDLYEFVLLSSSIKANNRLVETIEKNKETTPYFTNDAQSLIFDDKLDEALRKTVDENGYILDTASLNLKKIRARLKNLDDRIKSRVIEIMNASKDSLTDLTVVRRDGRYCLCVKAECKNSFRGLIHDTSASQQTIYMEPVVVAEMEEEKNALFAEEKEEINLILRNMSSMIKNYADELSQDMIIMRELDLRFAKAMLAISYDGYAPSVNTTGELNLIDARHPLLHVEKVIPNSVSFGKEYLGIVITGPNTGGKTVFLKTVGLLSLMVKFGLLIPAKPESNVMLYDHIYCDIGDDQSIKENLSTFSSHMKKMVEITNLVTPKCLALFDEIGAGTDPAEGSSIAEAVLEYFLKNNVSFIITTHYARLKAFAYAKEQVVNASMQFDKETSNPTYHLEIGKSGSSNAFATAKRLGLRKEIVSTAIKHHQKESNNTDELIKTIEKEKDAVLELKASLNKELDEATKNKELYEKKIDDLEKDKNKILNASKLKTEKIVEDTINEATVILDKLKELENSNAATLPELMDVKGSLNKLKEKIPEEKKIVKKKVHHDYQVGDRVYLEEYQQYGNIEKIEKNGKFKVSFGNISISAKPSELTYVELEQNDDLSNHVTTVGLSEKHVSLTLDLRGVRASDAVEMIDKFIDDLIIAGMNSGQIIHGFGTGTIRTIVQNYCKNHKEITSYRYGMESEGGYGVTVFTLN